MSGHSFEEKPTALIARRVRQCRIELGLSQEDLGQKCGLHRTYTDGNGVELLRRVRELGLPVKVAVTTGMRGRSPYH